MPFYEYACDCGRGWTALRRVAERNTMVCECGRPARLLISLPAPVLPDLTPYYDVGLGQRIESRSQKQRVLRDLGAVEVGDRSGRPPHGAKGTVFSWPGQTARSVPKSGAYATD